MNGFMEIILDADGKSTIASVRGWRSVTRPGYFGRRRDLIFSRYDANYNGRDNWRLVWLAPVLGDRPGYVFNFEQACRMLYGESYTRYLQDRPDDVDFICEFCDCMDNSPTNIHSGCDYAIQEARSTHIQDIAVRNALKQLGRGFTGKRTELLVIRSQDSNGYRFGPGNVPFYNPSLIIQPSMCPPWANPGSVEDFWQSNKFLQVRE